MVNQDYSLIEYPNLDPEKLRDLFSKLPRESFWGTQEIDSNKFKLSEYVDYFSKSWAPNFYPELMIAAESGDVYAGLLHMVMEDKRSAITCLCTPLRNREGKKLLSEMIREGERRSRMIRAETIGIPVISGTCLTCGVDSANLDSVMFFRKLGFKPVESFYGMSLDLTEYRPWIDQKTICPEIQNKSIEYRHEEKEDEQIWHMYLDGEKVGKFEINGIRNQRTDVGIDITKRWRGKGLGTLLFNEGLRQIQEMGVKRAELAVDGDNIPAISLYNNAGFQVDRTYFVMDKALTNSEP
jgi:ribosomal protein S18 acetylase RimI-like enzyme